MAKQTVNIGSAPNDGTGDQLRNAYDKINDNFDEVYLAGPVGSNIQVASNTILSTDLDGNVEITPNGNGTIQLGKDVNALSDLSVTGNSVLSTVSSSGLATLASASVTGNATVGNDLGVSGAAVLSTTLNVTGRAFAADPDGIDQQGLVTIAYLDTQNDLPAGGTADQVLAKIDGTDYNTEWVTASGGSSISAIIPAINGVNLVVDSDTDPLPVLVLTEDKPSVRMRFSDLSSAPTTLTFKFDVTQDPLTSGSTGLTEFDIAVFGDSGFGLNNVALVDASDNPVQLYGGNALESFTDDFGVFKLRSIGSGEWVIYAIYTGSFA